MADVIGEYGTRYLCDILEDMRKAYETRNFSYLPGMIEELQYRAYRMENVIDTINTVKGLEKQRTDLKKEITELEEKKRRAVG